MATNTFYNLVDGSLGIGPTFDPDNATVVHDVTKTVKSSGGDSTTLDGAIDLFNNTFLGSNCKITVDSGLSVTCSDFDSVYGILEIEGDTRELAGVSYFHGLDILNTSTNAGAGSCTLSQSGMDLTVTGATTNPDFDADGWGSGDTVEISNSTGTATHTRTIDSVSNNVITFTGSINDPGGAGGFIYFHPNRDLNPSDTTFSNRYLKVRFKGFNVDADGAGNPMFNLEKGAIVEVENCAIRQLDNISGILCDNSLFIIRPETCTSHDANPGIRCRNGGLVVAERTGLVLPGSTNALAETGGVIVISGSYATASGSTRKILECQNGGAIIANDCNLYAANNTTDAALIDFGSYIDLTDGNVDSVSAAASGDGIIIRNGSVGKLTSCIINKFNIGLLVEKESSADIISGGATNCTTGFKADRNSYIDAGSTSGNMSGNTTDYSPATSDSVGNVDSVITHS